MKIRRYKERIATDWILDSEMGDWCRYEDVKPLLERIEELERQLITIRPMSEDERKAAREREEANSAK